MLKRNFGFHILQTFSKIVSDTILESVDKRFSYQLSENVVIVVTCYSLAL